MLFTKINNRIFFQRKQFFISNFEILFVNMRFCKFCFFTIKQCLLNDAFEKYLTCVVSKKIYDFVIFSFIMRRMHKKQLRVQNEMREAKAKLQRLEKQLKRLKNEKKTFDIKK